MIHFACASDTGYLPHCAAMIASLGQHHHGVSMTMHFLHDRALGTESLEKIKSVARKSGLEWQPHEIDTDTFSGLQGRGKVEGVMWFRVLLPDILEDLDRVIYLDCDLIVADSLSPLWDISLEDYYAAAVPNVFEPKHYERPKKLGLESINDYFNSGVMVLNLVAMRRDRIGEKILAVARERREELQWQDQDPFNIVFDGNWLHLSLRWNCQNSLYFLPYGKRQFGKEAVKSALDSPAVIHFEGPAMHKPWHRLCKHPHQKDYLQYRKRTPWSSVELEGDTLRNRWLRLLPAIGLIYYMQIKFWLASKIRKIIHGTGR